MKQAGWIATQAAAGGHVRLFCFPFAGGGAAAFANWQDGLAPHIQVNALQPPGRGARFGETPYREWRPLIDELVEALRAWVDLPYAFFGHSLGGLVAFELAHACAHAGLPAPCHLFISATNAPGTKPERPDITLMDDRALIARLRTYSGTPPEILGNEALMELLLPAIRADLTLLQNDKYQRRPALSAPVTLLAGRDDPHLVHDDLLHWRRETTAEFRQEYFPGNHFYLQPELAAVCRLLRESLRPFTSLTTNDR